MPIQTKAKNLLLLPIIDGWVSNPYNMPNSPSYDKKKASHNGIDLGWVRTRYTPILACQDGTVMQVFNNNSSIGNAIALQHDYEDGTHRFTAYIHLKEKPTLKVGAKVKQGQQIGIKGGSPYINGKERYGVHLHLYVSAPTTKKYSWDTMKSLVIDPWPLLYKSKSIEYNRLAVGDVKGYDITKLPYIEEAIPQVVSPVERDENKDQLTESSSHLRVRMTPSLTGTIIGFLTPNVYYDYYDMKEADNYEWYQIDANQWVARTDTMTILPKKTLVDKLMEENKRLSDEYIRMLYKIESIRKIIDET